MNCPHLADRWREQCFDFAAELLPLPLLGRSLDLYFYLYPATLATIASTRDGYRCQGEATCTGEGEC